MTNLEKAQKFAMGQCLSEYPINATYDDVRELLDDNSEDVIAWQPFENCDVVVIMDDMIFALERLLNEVSA